MSDGVCMKLLEMASLGPAFVLPAYCSRLDLEPFSGAFPKTGTTM
jgi:hypothetical protein